MEIARVVAVHFAIAAAMGLGFAAWPVLRRLSELAATRRRIVQYRQHQRLTQLATQWQILTPLAGRSLDDRS